MKVSVSSANHLCCAAANTPEDASKFDATSHARALFIRVFKEVNVKKLC